MPVRVKEAIRRVEGAGWELARTRGSHRQYRHPNTLHPKMTERRYLIVIEGGDDVNFWAYAADLPGCVATGATLEEREMREAIAFHIEGLRASGQPVPEPSRVTASYVDVAA